MPDPENVFILLFKSTHQVIRAERALKNIFRNVSTIPVPEKYSSDCGVALEIKDTVSETSLKKVLADHGIETEKIAAV